MRSALLSHCPTVLLKSAIYARAEYTYLSRYSWLRGLADYAVGIVLSFTEDLAGAVRCLQHALQTDELKLDLPFYCGAEIYLGMIVTTNHRDTKPQSNTEDIWASS